MGLKSEHNSSVFHVQLIEMALKIILHSVPDNFVYETAFHSLEFSTCPVTLAFKKFSILECFGF